WETVARGGPIAGDGERGTRGPCVAAPKNYLALPLKEGNKRRSNRQPSSVARGRGGEHHVPPGMQQEAWGFAGRTSCPPPGAGSTQPAVKGRLTYHGAQRP